MPEKGWQGVRGRLDRRFRRGGGRGGLSRAARTVYAVTTGFLDDHCMLRASALTFITMLSIVPFLAVAFSIAKGFGLQNAGFIRRFLMDVTAGRGEVVAKILQYIGNTNVRTLGWIGVGTLLVTVFTTVGNVERAFNTIWRVRRGRSSWRKFTDFFSVIVICPVLALAATSLTVMLQKLELVHEMLRDPDYGSLEKLLLKLVSLALVWLGFTFVYSFVPNTRVRLRSAVVGGVAAGSMWQGAQWLYIHWQIGFSKYNAIYGSFAQLPLFLVWLYISWIIVLIGAELSFVVQHPQAAAWLRGAEGPSPRARIRTALSLLRRLAARFAAGLPPEGAEEAALALDLPAEAVREAFAGLVSAGLVAAVGAEEPQRFLPAVDPARIRMTDVLRVVALQGGDAGPEPGRDDAAEGLLAEFARTLRASPADISLSEFARRPAGDQLE